ncbi:glycosyltransferase family 4 protein [Glycomyces xiaoerkulensis]|uniref:glycosyltransferase family 4 protein n=1 Tax=Glycomyces xiaoerkulensis TaxID=2038139 RepID=UPI000C263163|nr:glycosyltransferase family 4 protein [Glycomyces xiaoerkulensis]
MTERFDACVVLNYYAPYISGLTQVARDVAESLAGRGRRVAVVASRHHPDLPRREELGGVHVFRSRVAARIGRGVISPEFIGLAGRVARRSAVVNLHLPMLEAGPVARAAGNTPIVCHHHDDVWLPGGALASAQIAVVERSVAASLRRSAGVVVSNLDHARDSRHWHLMRRRKVHEIPPPCRRRGLGRPSFRDGPGPHVGFLGRMAPEKGLHHLVAAFGHWPDPEARLLLAGEESGVAGGGVAAELRRLADDDRRVRFLGRLDEAEFGDFHASIDAFALPSVAEESFGITQTEALMAGVPVVASDLPGMRVPVRTTGFGELVPAGSPEGLAAALRRVCAWGDERRVRGAEAARDTYSMESTLESYAEALDEAADRAAHR